MAYLVLLFCLVGLHMCVTKMASIVMDIAKDFKKIHAKSKKHEFRFCDYVNAQERLK